MAKMGSFRALRGGSEGRGRQRGGEGNRAEELRAPGRIYRVIIVILVIDYPRTISAAPWLCIPAGVRIYIARNVVYAIPWPDVLRRVVWK